MVDVLIVDDRPDGLLALEVALKLASVRLVKAGSGHEALDLIDRHEFALILLDVQMPGLDGFQTAALIRERPGYRTTPIIFVTAINKDDAYVYDGYNAGAVDYIFKPFDPQVLRSKVGVFVDLHLKTQELKEHERLARVRKIAELELENMSRYRTLADSIPHVVWKARGDGVLYYFNQTWLRYTGLTHEQSVGMGWQKAVHDDDLGGLLKAWLRSMDDSSPFETEARLRAADGHVRWHLIRLIPELSNERLVAWIGTCTDIHDKKLAETRLIEAEREAVAANVAKTNFLANMSHEIRTPMGAILGFSELMLKQEMTEERRTHCTRAIQRGGKQLLRLIDEILDISKVEAGRLDVEKVGLDPVALLTDLYTLMDVQTRDRELDLEFTFATPVPERVLSDPTRLWQILVNMVGNAIKFTRHGKVAIETGWSAGRLNFRVRDTGIGIDVANDNVKSLFQPFVQMDSSTTRRFGGTGLGLYLSRKIAHRLGGDITIGTPPEGFATEFLIEIDAPAEGAIRSAPDLRRFRAPEPAPVSPGIKRLAGLNVLLIEDLVDNQELISSFLIDAGAAVDIADNGTTGIERALSGAYDVVLMDIQMPGLDGYEATTRLRARGYAGPIIALTAHALAEERARSRTAGCSDHLTKPIDWVELVDRVAHHGRPPAIRAVDLS